MGITIWTINACIPIAPELDLTPEKS